MYSYDMGKMCKIEYMYAHILCSKHCALKDISKRFTDKQTRRRLLYPMYMYTYMYMYIVAHQYWKKQ
jgi:hypothetical protein